MQCELFIFNLQSSVSSTLSLPFTVPLSKLKPSGITFFWCDRLQELFSWDSYVFCQTSLFTQSAAMPLRITKRHSVISANYSHRLMHTCLASVCVSVSVCVFKQSCECLMNLLSSDWKLIKTASNRQPPTESHWQHADRQITAPQSEGGNTEHSLHLSDALPMTPPPALSRIIATSASLLVYFLSQSSTAASDRNKWLCPQWAFGWQQRVQNVFSWCQKKVR